MNADSPIGRIDIPKNELDDMKEYTEKKKVVVQYKKMDDYYSSGVFFLGASGCG